MIFNFGRAEISLYRTQLPGSSFSVQDGSVFLFNLVKQMVHPSLNFMVQFPQVTGNIFK